MLSDHGNCFGEHGGVEHYDRSAVDEAVMPRREVAVSAVVERRITVRAMATSVFWFSDIEGSTRLWAAHPDVMGAVLERHDGRP